MEEIFSKLEKEKRKEEGRIYVLSKPSFNIKDTV